MGEGGRWAACLARSAPDVESDGEGSIHRSDTLEQGVEIRVQGTGGPGDFVIVPWEGGWRWVQRAGQPG